MFLSCNIATDLKHRLFIRKARNFDLCLSYPCFLPALMPRLQFRSRCRRVRCSTAAASTTSWLLHSEDFSHSSALETLCKLKYCWTRLKSSHADIVLWAWTCVKHDHGSLLDESTTSLVVPRTYAPGVPVSVHKARPWHGKFVRLLELLRMENK
jgi:hypothetical protein